MCVPYRAPFASGILGCNISLQPEASTASQKDTNTRIGFDRCSWLTQYWNCPNFFLCQGSRPVFHLLSSNAKPDTQTFHSCRPVNKLIQTASELNQCGLVERAHWC